MSQTPQYPSRIPLRVDPKLTDTSPKCLFQKELPATPRPSKPRHLRLNHSALSTIYECSLDESKQVLRNSRWSIRSVTRDDAERDEDETIKAEASNQDDENQESEKSETSSTNSQSEKSLSTKPTSIGDSQVSNTSKPSCTIHDYKEAYQYYRVISLQSRKHTAAITLRATLDKTQFLINQVHVSSNPLNLLNSVLHQLPGSSSTIQNLREKTAHQQATLNEKTETFRLAIRNLLNTNQSLIRECEVLLKGQANPTLDPFTKERLAVHRLLTTFSTNEEIRIEQDDDLECQRDTLIAFNDYVGTLVVSLETQNAGLEKLIGKVNEMVRKLQEELNSYIRDKKSSRQMVRNIIRFGRF